MLAECGATSGKHIERIARRDVVDGPGKVEKLREALARGGGGQA
jgi:hypothetical protein